ncbi:MAG: class I SAM-dependent methyltransferase [Pseudomonadota bacterium]
MTFIDNKKELEEYAKAYASKTPPNSLKNLAFKHLPSLFKKYNTDNKALDFGCGVGYSTSFLKSLGFDCRGVDINPKMVELAKENDKKGTYQSIVNLKIPYDNETFDLVFASFVLLEMSSLKQIEEALIEISRVLKPEGHFVAILDNENMYKYSLGSLNTDFAQNKTLENGKKVKVEFIHNNLSIEDYFWTQESCLSAMQNANLELLEISNPLADPNDEIEWKDETRISPISIYFTRKT